MLVHEWWPDPKDWTVSQEGLDREPERRTSRSCAVVRDESLPVNVRLLVSAVYLLGTAQPVYVGSCLECAQKQDVRIEARLASRHESTWRILHMAPTVKGLRSGLTAQTLDAEDTALGDMSQGQRRSAAARTRRLSAARTAPHAALKTLRGLAPPHSLPHRGLQTKSAFLVLRSNSGPLTRWACAALPRPMSRCPRS